MPCTFPDRRSQSRPVGLCQQFVITGRVQKVGRSETEKRLKTLEEAQLFRIDQLVMPEFETPRRIVDTLHQFGRVVDLELPNFERKVRAPVLVALQIGQEIVIHLRIALFVQVKIGGEVQVVDQVNVGLIHLGCMFVVLNANRAVLDENHRMIWSEVSFEVRGQLDLVRHLDDLPRAGALFVLGEFEQLLQVRTLLSATVQIGRVYEQAKRQARRSVLSDHVHLEKAAIRFLDQILQAVDTKADAGHIQEKGPLVFARLEVRRGPHFSRLVDFFAMTVWLSSFFDLSENGWQFH